MFGLLFTFLIFVVLAAVYFDLPRQISLFFLDTPEKYWIVVFGYHVHKMFWGFFSLLISMILFGVGRSKLVWAVAKVACFIGIGLVLIDLFSHWYTQGTPYFALWDMYIPPSAK